MKQIITTTKAPTVVGPYSQATKFENLIFTAGQIPINPATNEAVEPDIAKQTKQALENLKNLLEAAGSSLDLVLKTTVFLTDLANFNEMNKVYAEYFTENYPARSTIQVSRLPKDVLVEIEAIAYSSK